MKIKEEIKNKLKTDGFTDDEIQLFEKHPDFKIINQPAFNHFSIKYESNVEKTKNHRVTLRKSLFWIFESTDRETIYALNLECFQDNFQKNK